MFVFRDGLVWTVDLTVEIKLRVCDGLVWTVGLTVEIKPRFRDGLVWIVGLTVEIKLRFKISFSWWCGCCFIHPRMLHTCIHSFTHFMLFAYELLVQS